MKKIPQTFHYYPVDIKQSYNQKNVKGFKFPSGDEFKDGRNNDVADEENLQNFFLYFGVNEVIASIEDLQRTGTTKTNRLYKTLLTEILKDYNMVGITCLRLASSMCWVPTYDNKENSVGFTHKLSPDRALFEIEPAVKGLLLAIQTKMDLTFPLQLVKNIARLEIEKDLLEFEEATGAVMRTVDKRK